MHLRKKNTEADINVGGYKRSLSHFYREVLPHIQLNRENRRTKVINYSGSCDIDDRDLADEEEFAAEFLDENDKSLRKWSNDREDDESTLTKACFLFRGTNLSEDHEVSDNEEENFSGADDNQDFSASYFTALQFNAMDEPNRFTECRYKIFKQFWHKIQTTIAAVVNSVNYDVLESITDFVVSSYSYIHVNDNQSTTIPIPTALVMSGFNSNSDYETNHKMGNETRTSGHGYNTIFHGMSLGSIVAHLRARGLFVATLESSHATNIRVVMDTLLSQFIQHTNNGPNSITIDKLPKADFQSLHSWYWNFIAKQNQNSNTNNEALSPPLLVVVFEDVESFNTSLLNDVIRVLSDGMSSSGLPFVFVFGVATSTSNLYKLLSQSTSANLRTKKFTLQESDSVVSSIIQSLFITDVSIPLKLEHEALSYIISVFKSNFSVKAFVNSLKFLLMNHFYNCPFSFLIGLVLDRNNQLGLFSECQKLLNDLTPFHWKFMTTMTSMRNAKPSIAIIENAIRKMIEYQKNFRVAWECFQKLIPTTTPSGKNSNSLQTCEEFLHVLQNNHSHISAVIQRIRYLNNSELSDLVSCWKSILETSVDITDTINPFKKFYDKCLVFINRLDHYCNSQITNGTSTEQSNKPKKPARESEMQITWSASKRRQKALEKYVADSEEAILSKGNSFESIRMEVVQFLKDFAETFFVDYKKQSLHEVFYCNQAHNLDKLIFGKPGTAVQQALSQPHKLLRCQCATTTQRNHICHDTCNIYGPFQESGKLINLYDWFDSYCAAQSTMPDNGKDELQCRFSHAIGEMQFLGLIQPTKKKTDHVAKTMYL